MKEETKNFWKKIGNYAFTGVWLFSFVYIIENYGASGGLGLIVVTLLFPLFRLWQRREQFIMAYKLWETNVFGKPLDKEYWKKGEFREKKWKLVWRKKNDKKTSGKDNKKK